MNLGARQSITIERKTLVQAQALKAIAKECGGTPKIVPQGGGELERFRLVVVFDDFRPAENMINRRKFSIRVDEWRIATGVAY